MRPIVLAGLLLVSSAGAAEDFTINVETDDRNGVCLVAFPRDDEMKLEISVRAKDANLNLSVQNIPSEWIDGHEDDSVPITIKPDKGRAIAIPNGEYVAGFTYRVDGWGLKGDKAMSLLAALKGGKSFTVEFGGHKVGAFQIQQSTGPIKDYAYVAMHGCMERNGGSTAF